MTILATALVLLTGVPAGFVGVECLIGLFGRPATATTEPPPAFAVLVPAHNEAGGIAATLAAAQAQLRASDRLLVVADNCTDDTAMVARAAGAEVVVRASNALRGKGYALAAGRDALRADGAPVAVVIVLDADCRPDPGALPLLAAMAARENAVLQALYLLENTPAAGLLVALSTFAFMVKNRARQRGLRALGGPALLQGTGMAFPWPVFDPAPLASGDLVEDLELGIALAISGVAVRFAEVACVRSAACQAAALRNQRTRWEHGSLAMTLRVMPPLLQAIARGRLALIWLVLDRIVPPLALLGFMLGVSAAIGVLVWQLGGGAQIATAVMVQIGWLAVTIGLVWTRFGRAILSAGDLVRAPLYLLWKLPIYLRLFGGRERRWIRTARNTDA